MSADLFVVCRPCGGSGEINTRQDYFGNWTDPRKCQWCWGEGELRTDRDLDDSPITWNGCNCDEGRACNYPPCVMQRDLEMRHMQALYRAGALTPPRDMQRQMYADIMLDAGRDYLLRDDERVF